ncbi:MAG TPA: hypothetical protein VEB20_06400 [Azospirillaceae bacterium]|nr:hypothetical protein [Azospirillaceae bacterium]
MDGGSLISFLRTEVADAASSFARRYRTAHAEAGLERLHTPALLDAMAEHGPAEVAARVAGMKDGITAENVDRVTGNLVLSYLFRDLKPLLERRMAGARASRTGPFAAPPSWLSGPGRLNWLREASCVTLNAVLEEWAAALPQGRVPACPFARVARAAKSFFAGSPLYRRADHDLLSISITGSNTALHVCFSLVEAATYLGLDLPAEEWRRVLWRSRKEIATLASGSLGMIVTYLDGSHLHPHGNTATSPTSREHCAFRLEGRGADARLLLDAEAIRPFSTGHDRLYTGCPAFHVGGLIETYLDWVLDIAVAQGLNRQPAPILVPAVVAVPPPHAGAPAWRPAAG